MPGAAFMDVESERTGALSFAASRTPVMTRPRFKRVRAIPERAPLAKQTSFENLLGELVRIASPVVADLLRNAASPGAAAGSAPASASGTPSPVDLLAQVLRGLLGVAAAPAGGAAISHPSSLAAGGNRFRHGPLVIRPTHDLRR